MHRRSVLAAAACGLTCAGWARQVETPTYEGLTFLSHRKPIRAIHYRPVGEGRRAAIVMMHGSGTSIVSRGPWHELAMRFAGDGYEVLTPLFTDAWPDDGIRPPPMMEAWRDVGEHAIDWFIARGVDRRRTAMFGYSLGSYVAVDGALGNSRAAAAISVAGGWDVYTPRRPLRRIPVLLISAERDTHVRPVSTAHWRHFLIEAGVPVRARTVRGAGHIMNRRQWEQVYAYALDFFNGHIGRISQ
jgi:dienelactone hydrolase